VDRKDIGVLSRDLSRRAGARVGLLDRAAARVFDTDPDIVDPFDDARRALASDRPYHDIHNGRIRVAAPVHIAHRRYVIVLRKRLGDVASATRVVRDAFMKAAVVGLAIALLLGIGLATTLLRRLERLRDATRELETRGLEAPAPVDHSPDELGDLSRTFAAMQSRLRRQEAARRAFVATASHELRTPLASLDAMLELLGEDLDAESLDVVDARERVAAAREQSQRLGQLASDLLDLSRLDAAIELRNEPVELSELCRAVMAEFERRASDQQTTLEFVPPSTSRWVTGDPGSIARIVRILLDNALRVSPPGQPVQMGVGQEDGHAVLTVSDRGPGIPPEERELIFERFQRGKLASGEGFGLGLAIGRELATRMGGALELVGEGPGGRFALRLKSASVAATVGER
jgi:signal transduction histidine kinase